MKDLSAQAGMGSPVAVRRLGPRGESPLALLFACLTAFFPAALMLGKPWAAFAKASARAYARTLDELTVSQAFFSLRAIT